MINFNKSSYEDEIIKEPVDQYRTVNITRSEI